MPFTPSTQAEATQRIMARLVARSALTDVAEAGTALAIATTVGEERASLDLAISRRLDAKFLDVSGADLDAACAQLPDGGVTRLGATAATGAVLVLTRTDTVGALVVPAGSSFSQSANPSLIYVMTAPRTFLNGSATVGDALNGYVSVTCTTLGTSGNALIGVIDTPVDVPDGVTSIEQVARLGGGITRETDAALRLRAGLYLQAFQGGNSRAAVAYCALTFQSQGGVRAKHAATFFDPTTLPGYVELVVDDGDQFSGQTRLGTDLDGTISNAQRRVYLEGPIVNDDLGTAQVRIGDPPASPATVQWTLVPEGGELWFDPGYLSDGDEWAVSDYSVYTGFISELQAVLNGTSTHPLTGLGWIAAGCRVRVMPPTTNGIRFSLNLVLVDGANFTTVSAQCEAVLDEYLDSLGPGVPFLLMDAYNALRVNVPNLKNATFRAANDAGQVCVDQDIYPTSERASLHMTSFEGV